MPSCFEALCFMYITVRAYYVFCLSARLKEKEISTSYKLNAIVLMGINSGFSGLFYNWRWVGWDIREGLSIISMNAMWNVKLGSSEREYHSAHPFSGYIDEAAEAQGNDEIYLTVGLAGGLACNSGLLTSRQASSHCPWCLITPHELVIPFSTTGWVYALCLNLWLIAFFPVSNLGNTWVPQTLFTMTVG